MARLTQQPRITSRGIHNREDQWKNVIGASFGGSQKYNYLQNSILFELRDAMFGFSTPTQDEQTKINMLYYVLDTLRGKTDNRKTKSAQPRMKERRRVVHRSDSDSLASMTSMSSRDIVVMYLAKSSLKSESVVSTLDCGRWQVKRFRRLSSKDLETSKDQGTMHAQKISDG